MAIQYRRDAPVSASALAALFDRAGLRRPTSDLARIQRMIDQADLILTAWDGDVLVGAARALTDFAWCCYLSDLAVDHAYQHQGIGKELVRQVREITGDGCVLVLLSAPDAMTFYPKIGLEAVQTGWMHKRQH